MTDEVLGVHYAKDAFRGMNARTYLRDVVGNEPDTAHARYEIYFPEDFQIHQGYHHGGSKLPGFANQRHGGASGGNHNPGASWSARMFCSSRDGLYNETDGADIPFNIQVYDGHAHGDYGYHHCWQKGADKGEWTTIDYRIELNTPGEADGVIKGWVNGEHAFEYDEYLFRDIEHAKEGIRAWRWHCYFGGRWGSPIDQSLYLRNFSLWAGDCPEM